MAVARVVVWLLCGELLLAFCPGLLAGARASRVFQAAPWKVERIRPEDGSPPFCRASAPMALAVGEVSLFTIAFEAAPGGRITMTEQIAEPVPEWMEYGKGPETGETTFRGCRFWFDDRALWPMSYDLDPKTGRMRYDLGGDPHFFEELAASRYLKMESTPGTLREENGERSFRGDFGEFCLSNTAPMVRQLQSCLAGLNDATPMAPVTVYEATPEAGQPPAPMPERLAAARQAVRQAPADDSDARAMACLRLGLAAADALRLGEARQAFRDMQAALHQGAPLTPALRRGLERFVEVLLLDERLDEAFAVANTVPDNAGLLAAVALARGDYSGADHWLGAAASRILGQPIRDWNGLARKGSQDFRMELFGGLAPAMRHLYVLWAMAALGQEKALVMQGCKNCVVPMGATTPAMAAANQVSRWLEGDILRVGAPDRPAIRRELGVAAFLRGDSLLRAGYLISVKSELAYALFELDGPSGADGWAARARVALAALTAAQGRASEALAEVREAAAKTEAAVGRESLPWIEAAALESEVALRIGDGTAAVVAARAGLTAAAACVPREHSLVYRLDRDLGQALLEQGDVDEAGRVIVTALGLERMPSFSEERLRSIRASLAVKHFPAARTPSFSLDPAARKREQEASERYFQFVGHQARERYNIVAAALGLPSLAGKLSVAARVERMQYTGSLFRLANSLPDPEQASGARLLIQAIGLDELRTALRLDGQTVGEGLFFPDALARITRGLSLLDVHRPLPPGASPYLMAQLLTGSMYSSALSWLSLDSMFPGEKRASLVPGEALEGLERLLGESHKLWLSLRERARRSALFEAVLVEVQAASRGGVLANVLTRAQLVGDPSLSAEDRHTAQQAIDGELWLRRQRGVLLDTVATRDPATPRLSPVRVLARRLDLSDPHYETAVSVKFMYHAAYGPSAGRHALETMTPFGTARYVFQLARAQRILGPEEAIVVWLPLRKHTHLFVIKHDACAWTVIPEGRASLGRHVRAIRHSIDAVNEELRKKGGHPVGVPYPADDAYALYDALFGSVAPMLSSVTHLYAVQLGVVGGIPLGLLVTRQPFPGQETQWLVDRFAITRVPALVNPDVFKRRTPPDRPANQLLAAGDPLVGDMAHGGHGESLAAVRSVSNIDRHIEPLPETRREMDSVASLLGLPTGAANPYIFAGERATPRRILDQLRHGRFQYILFATHGLVRFQDVGEPALVLSPRTGKRRPGDDGLLRASDIVGLDLDSDLVMLSACETAPSGEDGAEPLSGLASAFLVAGARSVLSTEWLVSTKAAETISTNLIAAMREGQRPARALQQAMRNLRLQKQAAWAGHPAYWAPYELVAFPQEGAAGDGR